MFHRCYDADKHHVFTLAVSFGDPWCLLAQWCVFMGHLLGINEFRQRDNECFNLPSDTLCEPEPHREENKDAEYYKIVSFQKCFIFKCSHSRITELNEPTGEDVSRCREPETKFR